MRESRLPLEGSRSTLLVQASVADVASIVTGLVTIALVCVTYASVAVARSSANAASASAGLAAKQLQEAQRPVLIPGEPRQEEDDLEIPVSNIGTGPALRVFAVAQFRKQPANVLGDSRSTYCRASRPAVRSRCVFGWRYRTSCRSGSPMSMSPTSATRPRPFGTGA